MYTWILLYPIIYILEPDIEQHQAAPMSLKDSYFGHQISAKTMNFQTLFCLCNEAKYTPQYSALYTVYTSGTLHNAQYSVYTVHCTVHCTLYNLQSRVHCTVKSSRVWLETCSTSFDFLSIPVM